MTLVLLSSSSYLIFNDYTSFFEIPDLHLRDLALFFTNKQGEEHASPLGHFQIQMGVTSPRAQNVALPLVGAYLKFQATQKHASLCIDTIIPIRVSQPYDWSPINMEFYIGFILVICFTCDQFDGGSISN